MKKMIKTPQFWKKDQKLSQEKLPQSNRHNPQKGKEMCKKILLLIISMVEFRIGFEN